VLVENNKTTGPLLPLNNCGVMALDYLGKEGVATSMGHSPCGIVDPVAGRTAIASIIKYCLGTYQRYGSYPFRLTGCGLVKMKAKTRSGRKLF
jgi:hypothetical protein